MPFLSTQRADPFRILNALTWIAVAVSFAVLLAPWYWVADLLAHFRVYYFIFLAPAAAVLFANKRYRIATLALVFAVLQLCYLLPYYGVKPGPADTGAPALKLASINVLTSNPDHQKVMDEITREDPDIVFLMEINQLWKKRLAPLRARWPYVLEYPQEDNFGVMLLSKIPWESARGRMFGEAGVRSLEVHFGWKYRHLTLLGIHPLPPMGEMGTWLRNDQLAMVVEAVRAEKGSVIVAGDFNATPWSASFEDFINATGLKDGALGHGLRNTWRCPPGFVRIPIDHICVSPDIRVRDFRVGSDIGSDHYPIYADLVFSDLQQWLKVSTTSLKDGEELLRYAGMAPIPREIRDVRYYGDKVTGGWHCFYLKFSDARELEAYLDRCKLLTGILPRLWDRFVSSENGFLYRKEFLPELPWFDPNRLKSGEIYSAVVMRDEVQIRCDVITDHQRNVFIQIGID